MRRELAGHHLKLLEASAIREDVAAERGYFSVQAKRDLEALGFGRSQQIVPTLVIPIYGVVKGEPPWYIHRPDEPRIKDGRPRKYEIPAGRKMSLDIHPRVRANLANPALPLFITEGSRKVDALITSGAGAVVGVIGVWNWRGRNDADGLALLPDWEFIALKEGRQVYVVYDSDVVLKEPVHQAMGRMGGALKRWGHRSRTATCPPATAGRRWAPTTSSPPAMTWPTSSRSPQASCANRRRRQHPPVGVLSTCISASAAPVGL